VAQAVKKIPTALQGLQDIIAILGIDELSERTRFTVARAARFRSFLSQPFHVAEAISTGIAGKYVKIADTVRSLQGILEGKYDDVPEQAFHMQGSIEDVLWQPPSRR